MHSLLCHIGIGSRGRGGGEYPYVVTLKKPWAHLGTRGHFLGITAKCPRTEGAAYYNFINYYRVLFNNAIRHSSQKNISDTSLGPTFIGLVPDPSLISLFLVPFLGLLTD